MTVSAGHQGNVNGLVNAVSKGQNGGIGRYTELRTEVRREPWRDGTMPHLEIALLGTMQATRDGQVIADRAYAKVLGLLAYLAVESDRTHQRASLSDLLWPEQPEDRARHSLRQALSTLRRTVGDDAANPPHILITRDTIAFNAASDHTVDVEVFNKLLDTCEVHDHQRLDTCPPCIRRLEQATALYRGDFLAGFSPGDSLGFDDWSQIHRQRVQQRALKALVTIGNHHERRGELDQATAAVRRQLELEPWLERAHRQLMELLWKSGRRNDALAQYERCRRVLEEELGVEPERETAELHAEIRASGASRRPIPPEKTSQASRIPVPMTRLVGREQELEDVADMLAQRDCRLLTLIGPGGSGKTRMAIQVAMDQVDSFPDGAMFVSLSSVRERDGIAAAIAAELGLQLSGGDEPEQQLLDWLRDRSLFLVLDNAEHLVDGMQLVPRMLAAARDIRILITSRERLLLHGEWVYDVRGLAYPASETTDSFEGYGAIELFGERLRQVRSRAPLRHEERPSVVRICQLVEGMPLAIELAAAWTQTLPLDQIASEIRKNLDFLSTSMRDLPDRHRSIRAVFHQTWGMLTDDEQVAYRKLSIFRDGFQLPAAEDVAGTSSHLLAALVSKSLVVQLPEGRYRLHELLRHYGEEMLQLHETEYVEMHDRHCHYYLTFLADREDALTGRAQQRALAEIGGDIENIRAAWQWGTRHDRVAALDGAAHALWLFYVMRGWMREGSTAFGRVVMALERPAAAGEEQDPARSLALAKSLVRYGGFRSGLGRYDHALSLLNDGIALLRRHDAKRELGLALNMLAAAIGRKGDCGESLGRVDERLAQFRAVRDAWGVAFSLNDLGLISHVLGDDDEAYRFCEESLAMFRRIGDRRGHAFAAHNLGAIAAYRGDYDRAKRLLREALALRQESEDQWGVASSYVQLGSVARVVGSGQEARTFLVKALEIAWESSVTPMVLDALVELSSLFLDEGQDERASEILAAIAAHPAIHGHMRERIAEMSAGSKIQSGVPPDGASYDRWAVRAVDDLARSLVG